MKYRDKSITLIQLLENACGAEFENYDLSIDIIEETLQNVASESNDILLWIIKNSQHQVWRIYRNESEAKAMLEKQRKEHPDEYFYIESEKI